MSTINRGVCNFTASSKIRFPTQSRNLRIPLSLRTGINFGASSRTRTRATTLSSFKQFSTMSPLQSGAPPPPQAREYDPEIKDIASYVHNTPINSDLAVSSFCYCLLTTPLIESTSSIPHDLFSSTH